LLSGMFSSYIIFNSSVIYWIHLLNSKV
jgi:hypothetical protein